MIDQTEFQKEQIAELVIQIYEIHETILAESEGLPGLRDGAMLHAATARPFATFDGIELYPTDFDKAAALFHSLIKSHPFMDGTKRTAFTAAFYFLATCGYDIPARFPKDAVIQYCIEIADENQQRELGHAIEAKTIAEIAEWFRYLLNL